jgi:polyhydroxybutyrate depolymerase
VPFKGGVVSCCGGFLIASAAQTMHTWSSQLQCTSSNDDKITKHVERRTWHGCSKGRQVIYYVVHGGGHTWPGPPGGDGILGHTTDEISAADVMWSFFEKHTTDG